MGFYKLKAGAHMSGSISDPDGKNTMQVFTARGPNNIVEDDRDLAAEFPEKFDRYDGPTPSRAMLRPGPTGTSTNEPRPPGPPTDRDRAEAQLMKAMTPDDRRKQAEWHRQQAESMEQEASEGERNMEIAKQQQEANAPPQSAQAEEDKAPDRSKAKSTKGGIPSDSELNQMTKDQLLEVAQQEEVDVKTHDTRSDILKALRTARRG